MPPPCFEHNQYVIHSLQLQRLDSTHSPAHLPLPSPLSPPPPPLPPQLGIPTAKQVFKKHGDLSLSVPAPLGASIPLSFQWAPYMHSIYSSFHNRTRSNQEEMHDNAWGHARRPLGDMLGGSLGDLRGAAAAPIIVMHAGLWDLLHVQSQETFRSELARLRALLFAFRTEKTSAGGSHDLVNGNSLNGNPVKGFRPAPYPVVVWIETSRVVDHRLASPDKRAHMNEAKVKAQRGLVRESGILELVDFSIDGWELTEGRETVDGVHYTERTYDSFIQVFANGLAQVAQAGGQGGQRGGSASGNKARQSTKTSPSSSTFSFLLGSSHNGIGTNPALGLLIMVLGATMLYTFDAFAVRSCIS